MDFTGVAAFVNLFVKILKFRNVNVTNEYNICVMCIGPTTRHARKLRIRGLKKHILDPSILNYNVKLCFFNLLKS